MLLDKCLESPVSEGPSNSKMVNGPKHCWNLKASTFTIIIDHFVGDWNKKKSLLVTWKILALFVNTLTTDDKNSLLNKDSFNAISWDAII